MAAPRRGRPQTIDSDKLLEVARQVFLERGIRATTAEVAERAGVSEGALFHRFKSKEGLFRAAMHLERSDVPVLIRHAVDAIQDCDIHAALTQLACELLEVGRVALPLMMMSWSNPNVSGFTPFDETRVNYCQFDAQLAAFFETQMKKGALRQMDAEVIARTFRGAVHHYCMSCLIMGDDHETIIPERVFVRGLVDLLLNGAAPAGAETAPAPQVRRLGQDAVRARRLSKSGAKS